MRTLGYFLWAVGAFLLRELFHGRMLADVPQDTKDLAGALLAGDRTKMAAIMARTGSTYATSALDNIGTSVINVSGGTSSGSDTGTAASDSVASSSSSSSTAKSSTTASVGSSSKGLAVLAEMKRLGGAGHYVWGGTGSGGGYDCSGLLYRACVNALGYRGGRFTSSSFPGSLSTRVVSGPGPGIVVQWSGYHIGMCENGSSYYSALSPAHGIKSTSISSITGHGRPTYREII